MLQVKGNRASKIIRMGREISPRRPQIFPFETDHGIYV